MDDMSQKKPQTYFINSLIGGFTHEMNKNSTIFQFKWCSACVGFLQVI